MAETRPVVLVTDAEYRKGVDRFTAATRFDCRSAPSDERDLAEAIRELHVRYVIVGGRRFSGPLYDALPAGGVIARFGVGYDGIDRARATAARLFCTNTPGVLDQSVAEHTMLLIAAAARSFTSALDGMARGDWNAAPGQDLYGKRLAVIGCGGIGRAVARIAALGYGMAVIGCTRPEIPGPEVIEHFVRVTNDFQSAVRDADFVSLHMPAKPETIEFLNRNRLGLLSERAWLINTARGAVVEETALFEALAARRIAGAALDVYAREPYVPSTKDFDFRTLPNVILTPHVGSNTVESNRRMADRALQNIEFAQAGHFERLDLINREVLA